MGGIGERLKEFINSTGLTLKTFASENDININTLSKNINEGNIPGGEVLKKLCSTGLNINWLLTGIGDMTVDPPVKSKLVYLQELKHKMLIGELNIAFPFASDSIWYQNGSNGLSDARRTFEEKVIHLLSNLINEELRKEIQKEKAIQQQTDDALKNTDNNFMIYYPNADQLSMSLMYYSTLYQIDLTNSPALKKLIKYIQTNAKNNNKTVNRSSNIKK